MLSLSFTETILDIARFENRLFLCAAVAIAALALFMLIGSATRKSSGRSITKNSSE